MNQRCNYPIYKTAFILFYLSPKEIKGKNQRSSPLLSLKRKEKKNNQSL
jgi:hypothetical protein